MSLFVAKMFFFLLSGSKKLTGESVRGRVIRGNMVRTVAIMRDHTQTFFCRLACLLSHYISPFIIYCLRHLLLFTCKQGHLQTCKYDQSLSITETYVHTHKVSC